MIIFKNNELNKQQKLISKTLMKRDAFYKNECQIPTELCPRTKACLRASFLVWVCEMIFKEFFYVHHFLVMDCWIISCLLSLVPWPACGDSGNDFWVPKIAIVSFCFPKKRIPKIEMLQWLLYHKNIVYSPVLEFMA